jgi:hypothetical protein
MKLLKTKHLENGQIKSHMWSLMAGIFAVLVVAMATLFPSKALAGETSSLKFGPGSSGNGGTNPIGIPPIHPLQIEYTSVSKTGFEWSLGLAPGILFGHRISKGSYYFSMGGGIIFSTSAVTIGAYNAFGYVTGDGKPGEWHFNYEFKQAIGPDPHGGLTAPSALRVGVIWE